MIVSNDLSNMVLNRVQVVPLSTRVAKIYPSEASVVLNGKKQKAMADQITTISKQRVANFEGRLSTSDMNKVDRVLALQLGL